MTLDLRICIQGLVAALLLAACGDNVAVSPTPDPDEVPVSGTRIKLVWNVTDEGVRTFAGFHDVQRDEDCTPTTWADGNTYCTPRLENVEGAYSDSLCTARLGFRAGDACGHVPSYLSDCGGAPCDPTTGTHNGVRLAHLFGRGAPFAFSGVVYHSDGVSCSPSMESGTFYAVGAEVAPQIDLVQMTMSVPTGSGRLATASLETVDGLRAPASFHDRQFATPCLVTAYADQPHCRPLSVTAGVGAQRYPYYFGDQMGPYADAGCVQQLVPTASPQIAAFVEVDPVTDSSSSSAPSYSYYDTGHQASSLYDWNANTSTCFSTDGARERFYPPGNVVSPAALDVIVESMPGRRLQRKLLTAPGFATRLTSYELTLDRTRYLPPAVPPFPRAVDPLGVLHDVELDTDCAFEQIADGTIACVPIAHSTLWHQFTDSACTNAIDVVDTYDTLGGAFDTGTVVTGIAPTEPVVPNVPPACVLDPVILRAGDRRFDPLWSLLDGICSPSGLHDYVVVTPVSTPLVRAVREIDP